MATKTIASKTADGRTDVVSFNPVGMADGRFIKEEQTSNMLYQLLMSETPATFRQFPVPQVVEPAIIRKAPVAMKHPVHTILVGTTPNSTSPGNIKLIPQHAGATPVSETSSNMEQTSPLVRAVPISGMPGTQNEPFLTQCVNIVKRDQLRDHRVQIGRHYERWCELRAKLALPRDETLAGALLDRWAISEAQKSVKKPNKRIWVIETREQSSVRSENTGISTHLKGSSSDELPKPCQSSGGNWSTMTDDRKLPQTDVTMETHIKIENDGTLTSHCQQDGMLQQNQVQSMVSRPATPEVCRATPEVCRATPEVCRATPEVSRATPEVCRATPEVSRATPERFLVDDEMGITMVVGNEDSADTVVGHTTVSLSNSTADPRCPVDIRPPFLATDQATDGEGSAKSGVVYIDARTSIPIPPIVPDKTRCDNHSVKDTGYACTFSILNKILVSEKQPKLHGCEIPGSQKLAVQYTRGRRFEESNNQDQHSLGMSLLTTAHDNSDSASTLHIADYPPDCSRLEINVDSQNRPCSNTGRTINSSNYNGPQVSIDTSVLKSLNGTVCQLPTAILPTENVSQIPTDTRALPPSENISQIPTDTSALPPSENISQIPTDTSALPPSENISQIPTDTSALPPSENISQIPTDTSALPPSENISQIPTDTSALPPSENISQIPTDTSALPPSENISQIPIDTRALSPSDVFKLNTKVMMLKLPLDTSTDFVRNCSLGTSNVGQSEVSLDTGDDIIMKHVEDSLKKNDVNGGKKYQESLLDLYCSDGEEITTDDSLPFRNNGPRTVIFKMKKRKTPHMVCSEYNTEDIDTSEVKTKKWTCGKKGNNTLRRPNLSKEEQFTHEQRRERTSYAEGMLWRKFPAPVTEDVVASTPGSDEAHKAERQSSRIRSKGRISYADILHLDIPGVEESDSEDENQEKDNDDTTYTTGDDDKTEDTTCTTGDDDKTEDTTCTTGDDDKTEDTTCTTGDDDKTEDTTCTTGDDDKTEDTTCTTGDDDKTEDTTCTKGDDDKTDQTQQAGSDDGISTNDLDLSPELEMESPFFVHDADDDSEEEMHRSTCEHPFGCKICTFSWVRAFHLTTHMDETHVKGQKFTTVKRRRKATETKGEKPSPAKAARSGLSEEDNCDQSRQGKPNQDKNEDNYKAEIATGQKKGGLYESLQK